MKRVLLIDDEKANFNIFRQLFQEELSIDYAADGKRGLTLFQKKNYDMVITNFNMPVMNGIELISEIRKQDDQIPIILITGNKEIEMKDTTVVYKPFDFAMMKKLIKQINVS